MIKEHIDLIFVGIVTLSIAMYDTVIDLFLNILHLLFELLHFAYEWLELGIEHGVEHIFHTSRHGSQIITFYILLLLAGLLSYWLWKVLPRCYRRLIQFVVYSWDRRKTECQAYWLSLPLAHKIKVMSTATGIFCLTTFLVM
jgi:hypothetical protein